jgi:hypothetical protein
MPFCYHPSINTEDTRSCRHDSNLYLHVLNVIIIRSIESTHHSSCCTNGFAISSLPSTGLTRTSNVPRATTSPRGRVEVLPSSSVGLGLVFVQERDEREESRPRTTSSTSSNTKFISASYPFSVPVTVSSNSSALILILDFLSKYVGTRHHTLPSSCKLDADFLVHVFPQVENILLLRPFSIP